MTNWKASHNRHMRRALLGILLAAAGAFLAFVIDYGPHNPWAFVAFALGLTGLGISGHNIMRGRAIAFAELHRQDREAAERRPIDGAR